VQRRRPDLIDLALTHGVEIGSVPFVDVLCAADKTVVSIFLSRGADSVIGFPFAHAIRELKAKTTLGMYLDCRRTHPELDSFLGQVRPPEMTRADRHVVVSEFLVGAVNRVRGPQLCAPPPGLC
jgi:hypothetical protein